MSNVSPSDLVAQMKADSKRRDDEQRQRLFDFAKSQGMTPFEMYMDDVHPNDYHLVESPDDL